MNIWISNLIIISALELSSGGFKERAQNQQSMDEIRNLACVQFAKPFLHNDVQKVLEPKVKQRQTVDFATK